MTKNKECDIENEGQEFGMADVGEPKKYKPNVVKEDKDVNNLITID